MYFGTPLPDGIKSLAVDGAGNLIALGFVSRVGNGRGVPATGAPQLKGARVDGNRDGFLAALAPTPSGRTYVYGSLIGGDYLYSPCGLVIAPDGSWVVALQTQSPGLYTTPNAVSGSNPSVNPTSAYVRVLPSPLGN